VPALNDQRLVAELSIEVWMDAADNAFDTHEQ
jgi:hypothetical protein